MINKNNHAIISGYYIIFLISTSVISANSDNSKIEVTSVGQNVDKENQSKEGNMDNTSIATITTGQEQNKKQIANNYQELENMMMQEREQLNQENQNKEQNKNIEHQNKVRLAIHAMIASQELTGTYGEQISQIAKGFNNSLQATIQAEEKIQERSAFKRFFAGGNSEAAQEIEKEVNTNREKINELNTILNYCEDCDSQVKLMLHEEIKNMQEEQYRLE